MKPPIILFWIFGEFNLVSKIGIDLNQILVLNFKSLSKELLVKQTNKIENSKFVQSKFYFINQAKPLQKFKLKSWGASILLWEPTWIFSLILEMLECSK